MSQKKDEEEKEKSVPERIADHFAANWGKYALLAALLVCGVLGYKNRNKITLSWISGNNNKPITGSSVITNNIDQSDNRSFDQSDNRKFDVDQSDNSVTNITNEEHKHITEQTIIHQNAELKKQVESLKTDLNTLKSSINSTRWDLKFINNFYAHNPTRWDDKPHANKIGNLVILSGCIETKQAPKLSDVTFSILPKGWRPSKNIAFTTSECLPRGNIVMMEISSEGEMKIHFRNDKISDRVTLNGISFVV
eukprot:480919_1